MTRRLLRFLNRYLIPETNAADTIKQALEANLRTQREAQEKADLRHMVNRLSDELLSTRIRQDEYRTAYIERSCELIEAKQMAGSGPWLVSESRGSVNAPGKFRESNAITSQGAYGDIELALQNVEWRREINLSWLEFSRWGIQQIILISRLYFIKNPLIQRGVNVAAHYVFGRGVEVSSPDETANEVLKDFFERNKSVLGQIALTNHERSKYQDGNLFFAFFADTQDSGLTNVRTIDATEIMDIVCDPNDSDKPWLYRRCWTERNFNVVTGSTETHTREAWYPALDYSPAQKPETINGNPVYWGNPVLHRKCGGVAKWHYGLPLVYAALDWAKTAKGYLESCYTVAKAHAQLGIEATTKGGQQAIEGMKQQLSTTVGPNSSLWDTNPPGPDASIYAYGPGTKIAAFRTRGAGADPKEVGKYVDMVACVLNIPPTFFGDLETANLATATSLDRPTELNFLEKQEAWREDLLTIAKYVLGVSRGATSGKLRESIGSRTIEICEARRVRHGIRWVMEAVKRPDAIEVSVNFPAIVEGDIPALVTSAVTAMTLGNRGGQIVGTDEKATIRFIYDLLGIENADELIESQYPEGEYDPDRTQEILPAPIAAAAPFDPGGKPQLRAGQPDVAPAPKPREAQRLARLLVEAVAAEKPNGKLVE